MANYPAPPGHRMAYDRDGSVIATITSGGVATQLTNAQAVALNNESDSDSVSLGNGSYLAVIFPQLRDLVGFFIAAGSFQYGANGSFQTSPDTTNGVDGTWTTRSTPVAGQQTTVPKYRNSIVATAVAGIKAVRYTWSYNLSTVASFHLYGDISAGSEDDSLQLWDPAVDQRLAASALDFGDVPRSNVSQKQFRLKNRSATKTANNVSVGVQALTDATPSLGSQHQFSLDGSTWASTVTVTSIAPGAISPIIYVRRSTNAAAALSVWAARITCVPGSWT